MRVPGWSRGWGAWPRDLNGDARPGEPGRAHADVSPRDRPRRPWRPRARLPRGFGSVGGLRRRPARGGLLCCRLRGGGLRLRPPAGSAAASASPPRASASRRAVRVGAGLRDVAAGLGRRLLGGRLRLRRRPASPPPAWASPPPASSRLHPSGRRLRSARPLRRSRSSAGSASASRRGRLRLRLRTGRLRLRLGAGGLGLRRRRLLRSLAGRDGGLGRRRGRRVGGRRPAPAWPSRGRLGLAAWPWPSAWASRSRTSARRAHPASARPTLSGAPLLSAGGGTVESPSSRSRRPARSAADLDRLVDQFLR